MSTTETNESPLLTLNFDCQKHLFEFLYYEEVVALNFASPSHFRECARQWMKQYWMSCSDEDEPICLIEESAWNEEYQIDPVEFLTTFGPCASRITLRIPGDQQEYLNILPECCPNLESLNFEFMSELFGEKKKVDISFLGRMHSIRSLNADALRGESILKEIAKLPHLERLRIKYGEYDGKMLSELHNLKELDISHNENITGEEFISAFRANPNLTRINVNECLYIGPDVYEFMVKDSRQLDALEFNANFLLRKRFIPGLKHLKSLTIHGKCKPQFCQRMLQEYSESLGETLTSLKIAHWINYRLSETLHFPNLIELSLIVSKRMDADGILRYKIPKMCPRLERITLKVDEYVSVRQDSLLYFFRQLTNVVYADIRFGNGYNVNLYKSIVEMRKDTSQKLTLIVYREIGGSRYDPFEWLCSDPCVYVSEEIESYIKSDDYAIKKKFVEFEVKTFNDYDSDVYFDSDEGF